MEDDDDDNDYDDYDDYDYDDDNNGDGDDGDGARTAGVLEEIVHVEDELLELEGRDDAGAARAQEALAAVEGDLSAAFLPPGCDLDCFFENHPAQADTLERTEEAVAKHLRQKRKRWKQRKDWKKSKWRRFYNHACDCQGKHKKNTEKAPQGNQTKNLMKRPGAVEQEALVERPRAGPEGAVVAGAIEEILHVEEEIEALEQEAGDGAALEEQVLAAVEEELIEAVLPPGCDLDCFFDRNEMLADEIEHTEEAVLGHFQEQKRKIPSHACDCRGKTAIEEGVG